MSNFDPTQSQEQLLSKSLDLFWAASQQELSGLSRSENSVKIAAKIYFSLSRAYKSWRVVNDHNTQPAKIAALTAISIMLVRPIYSSEEVESKELYYSNPFYALQTGCAIVGSASASMKEDTTLRIASWLDMIRISSASKAISVIDSCISSGEFLKIEDINVSLAPVEVVAIDMLVATFELLELSKSA